MESTSRSKHIKRRGRGEIDNVSATPWMSDEAPPPPTPGSENSPLKSDKRIWSPEWDGMDKEKNQVGQKWNKLQQNTRMYKWTQTDARAIFINETDILHLFSLCTKR